VGGTSASSPIFASVLALLNVASIQKTGKPIGFANPFLYKMHADCEDCFQDIIGPLRRKGAHACSSLSHGLLCLLCRCSILLIQFRFVVLHFRLCLLSVVGNNRCTENGCATSCQGYECAKGSADSFIRRRTLPL
jgi:hypothetical protein